MISVSSLQCDAGLHLPLLVFGPRDYFVQLELNGHQESHLDVLVDEDPMTEDERQVRYCISVPAELVAKALEEEECYIDIGEEAAQDLQTQLQEHKYVPFFLLSS